VPSTYSSDRPPAAGIRDAVQEPSGKWRRTWSAVKPGAAEAKSKSGRVTKFFRTEPDADEAALLAACAWINAYEKL
jgi:hypothetical protein